MNKLAVVVNNLGASQLNYYLIKRANKWLETSPETDFIVFYETLVTPFLDMQFPTMQATELFGYDGVAVATTLNTAAKLTRCPSVREKLFYVWDLEWLRVSRKHYNQFNQIYSHPELKLMARSAEHARLIEQCWNKPVVGVIDDFNFFEGRP